MSKNGTEGNEWHFENVDNLLKELFTLLTVLNLIGGELGPSPATWEQGCGAFVTEPMPFIS